MTTKRYAGGPVGPNQAVDGDYKNSGYNRGHVYPHCHNCDEDQAESTFTLTNAAPQTGPDNIQWYNEVEKKVIDIIDNLCRLNTAHVVTGVIPGTKYINFRVNIPSYYWSAFCCKDKNSNSFISRGYTLEMNEKGTAKAEQWSLDRLNTALGNGYKFLFQVFGTLKGCS